jgi:chitinase
MSKNRGKIGDGCTDCVGCIDDPENQEPCCGCACMDCIYGYSDLDDCDSCDPIPYGTWPWDGYLDISITKREISEENSGDISSDVHREVSHLHRGISHLHRRISGKATRSPKKVTVCDDRWYADEGGLYPAFPALAANPWDGIENGKWDPISRYWGNSSDSCTSWAVSRKSLADEVWVGPTVSQPSGSMQRAQYQSTFFSETWRKERKADVHS